MQSAVGWAESLSSSSTGDQLSTAQIALLAFQSVLVCVFFFASFWVGKKAYDKVHAMEKAEGLDRSNKEDDIESETYSITES